MFPFVFKYGTFTVPTFFTMVMLGVLATTFYLYFRAPKLGFSQVAVLDLGIVGAITGILGARIYHVLVEGFIYSPELVGKFYREDWTRVFEFWRGGFVSYGAYIGGTLGVLAYLKIRKLPILKYADFVALAIPLLVIFIRIGCIGAGCCYGKPTDFFIHLVFPGPQAENGPAPGVPLHATQLYDLLNGVFLFVLLNWYYARRKFDGQIVLLLFMIYSFFRGLIEFLRGDEDRGVYLKDEVHSSVFSGLSSAQITGLATIALCLILYVILSRRAKAQRELNSAPAAPSPATPSS